MQMHTQEVVFDEQVYAIDGITPEIEHELKNKTAVVTPAFERSCCLSRACLGKSSF